MRPSMESGLKKRFPRPPAAQTAPSFASPRQLSTRRSSHRSSPFNPSLMNRTLLAAPIFACLLTAGAAPEEQNAKKQATQIVARIQRADYEGDRETLKKCYEELTPFLENKDL